MNNVVNIFAIILCIGLGIGIGTIFDVPLEVDPNIGIIELLNVVVTIIVAIYITRTLEKQVQDYRVEKDMLIERINQVESFIAEIEKLEANEEISYTFVNNKISKSREKKNRLIIILKKKVNKTKSKKLEEIDKNMKSNFSYLKNLLTNTPILPAEQPEISMEGGMVKYSQTRIDEIVVTILNLNDNLLELKLFVNTL